MDELLPVVKAEVGFSVTEEINVGETDADYIFPALRRLQEVNPCVANFIATFAAASEDTEGVLICGLVVYRLLESQAEADRMALEFKFDPSE